MTKNVLVIKLGTALLTNSKGNVQSKVVERITREISGLMQSYNVVLVSSGAVGSGKKYIQNYKGNTEERRAASAIGNPLLMRLYYNYFSKKKVMVAQVLCERHHFSDRKLFLELKETFGEFWKNGILPIVNENDLVSNIELKFSDNDELATLIAVGFDAHYLILCTSAGGLLDAAGQVIPRVDKIDKKILGFVRMEKSASGLGGMSSKLTYTKLASSLGIKVMICGLEGDQPLDRALEGKYGTTFVPKKVNLHARNKWLASSSVTIGEICVDKGAARALISRHSLLTVGIRHMEGRFLANEVVKLFDEEHNLLGVAKVKISATEMQKGLKSKNLVAAHANDIVIF